MKRSLLLAGLLASTPLLAANTDPVGVVTSTINGGNPGFTALTFPLYQSPVESFTPSSVGSNNVTAATALFAGDNYAATDANGLPLYFIEVVDGPSSGNLIDVIANTDNSLTLDVGSTDLTTIIDSSTRLNLRRHNTIASVFGSANSAGLTTGGDDSTSDLIYIMSLDGSGSYDGIYYYQTDDLGFLGGTGWRESGDINTDKSSVRIDPDQAVIVKRISPDDVSVTVTGDVKMSSEIIPLSQGFNLVGSTFPINLTLDSSNLFTGDSNGVRGGSDDSTADLVYLLQDDGSFRIFYYQIDDLGFLGGTGWRESGDINTPQGTQPINPAQGLIIRSRNSDTAWIKSRPYLNE